MRTSEETVVFNRLFSEAEIACLNKEDLKEYEDILKAYLDIKIPIETAKEEGFAKGYAEGFIEGFVEGFKQGIAKSEQKIVHAMIQQGCDAAFISKVTGISIDTITTYLEYQ